MLLFRLCEVGMHVKVYFAEKNVIEETCDPLTKIYVLATNISEARYFYHMFAKFQRSFHKFNKVKKLSQIIKLEKCQIQNVYTFPWFGAINHYLVSCIFHVHYCPCDQ